MKVKADDGSYRQATIIDDNGEYYNLDNMKVFLPPAQSDGDLRISDSSVTPESGLNPSKLPTIKVDAGSNQSTVPININQLNISQRSRDLIINGYDSQSVYSSHSELDLAVILGLVSNGINPLPGQQHRQ